AIAVSRTLSKLLLRCPTVLLMLMEFAVARALVGCTCAAFRASRSNGRGRACDLRCARCGRDGAQCRIRREHAHALAIALCLYAFRHGFFATPCEREPHQTDGFLFTAAARTRDAGRG